MKNTTKAIYATRNYDNGIRENACIAKFASIEAAREWLLAPYIGGGWDMSTAKVAPSREWGDCWIKSNGAPAADSSWIAPFSLSQLYIERPGQHPGGRRYWTTPHSHIDIYVVSEIREEAE